MAADPQKEYLPDEDSIIDIDEEAVGKNVLEPGACSEKMLVTTDSFEEFEQEMDSSFDERQMKESTTSTISEIQEELHDGNNSSDPDDGKLLTNEVAEELASRLSETSLTSVEGEVKGDEDKNGISEEDEKEDALATPVGSLSGTEETECWQNAAWKRRKKHIFILSAAGKPVYSRYGNEDKQVTLFGVMQALVSFVADGNDSIRSIHAGPVKFVFLTKGPVILVAVSRTVESVAQVAMQLTYAHNQIVSVLTSSQLARVFEQRRNYDLRRLLSGAERLLDRLLSSIETQPAFLLCAIRCLPLASSAREVIGSTIQSACSKIKNLVFAILVADDQLISLVRMKKYFIHPADLHLIFNLVSSSESFKAAESWTPICLPRFDSSGYLHGHVSYLSDDCQACLLLLTVDRDVFFTLSGAKQRIVERLRRCDALVAINKALAEGGFSASAANAPGVRHFLYKCRTSAQFACPRVESPYVLRSHRSQNARSEGRGSGYYDTSDDLESNDNSSGFFTQTSSSSSFGSNTKLGGSISGSMASGLSGHDDDETVGGYGSGCEEDDEDDGERRLMGLYQQLYHRLHSVARPQKVYFRQADSEAILGWVNSKYELYVIFEPLINKANAISAVDKILSWIKEEEDRLFIRNAPTF
ncbi:vacuolar fusion protein MON1 homolog [Hetaerina americana]|uniref:vacuolar fusion protein MON1 homolog n=1 Tax=Hetaerina americana TaxID=62018 RepID=UPI003A7F2DB3